MSTFIQIDPSEYLNIDLRVHSILKNVPIHDVWRLDLPSKVKGHNIMDIRSLFSDIKPNALVKILFAIRRLVGRTLGWDQGSENNDGLFQNKLTDTDRSRSHVTTGTKDGPFTVLFVYDNESLSEIYNRTVHAALAWVLISRESGYRLYWSIYVKPVGWFTNVYMFLIDPFRRWIVYPSLLSQLHRLWCEKYNSD